MISEPLESVGAAGPEPSPPPEISEENPPTGAPDHHPCQNCNPDECESTDENSESDEDSLQEPIYDKADGVYRCAKPDCGWEVAFGHCQGCQIKYTMEDDSDEWKWEAVDPRNPLTVFTKGLIVERGDSPPPADIPANLRPLAYIQDPHMFNELIARGATLAFCETWEATFDDKRGIIVRANAHLRWTYETIIEEGGSWTIWIGRRIELCSDDLDGSLFMEEILDLIFTEDHEGLWITYKEDQEGTSWVTRPKEGSAIDGLEIVEFTNEYEILSGEEDDRESIGSYASDTSESEARSTSNPDSSEPGSTWWSDDSENSMEEPAEGEAEVEVPVDARDGERAEDTQLSLLWVPTNPSESSIRGFLVKTLPR